MTGQSQSQTKCLWPKAVEYYTRFCWWRVILKSNVFENGQYYKLSFFLFFFPKRTFLREMLPKIWHFTTSSSRIRFYDVSYDPPGDKSIQCSRRPDAFKFWMAWKALGTLGLEEEKELAPLLLYLGTCCVCVCVCVHGCLIDSLKVRLP